MGSLRAKGWRSNTRSRGAWRLGKASIWDLRTWREPAVLAALYTLRLLRSWKLAKVLEGAAEAEQLVLALAGCKPGGRVSRLAVAKLWGGTLELSSDSTEGLKMPVANWETLDTSAATPEAMELEEAAANCKASKLLDSSG